MNHSDVRDEQQHALIAQLTAERDALLEVRIQESRALDQQRAENERLRAELALAKPVFSRRQLEAQLTALADAAELVMRSDYTGYTHRMLEQALRAIGRGPYAPYGDASADMSPEAAQLTELRDVARDALASVPTWPERMRAVLAKLTP